jgi:hypothetical protein
LCFSCCSYRSFFNAFFSLSPFNWHGFLSARLGFFQLISFGLSLFANSSNQSRLDLLSKGLPGLVGMLLELAPTVGDYYGVQKEQKLAKQQQALQIVGGAAPAAPAAAAAAANGNSSSNSSGGQQQEQKEQQQQAEKVPVGAGSSSSSSSSGSSSS